MNCKLLNKLLLLMILITAILQLNGCGSSENSLYDVKQEELTFDKEILPEREDIKASILENIANIGNVNNAPNLSATIDTTYFVLSKFNTDISENHGVVEVAFILIDNYQLSNEIKYSGEITYEYDYILNENNQYEWILDETSTAITFKNVITGTISGKVHFLNESLMGAYVFAVSGDELTKVVQTDSEGNFQISDVLINDYIIHIYGDKFPEFVKNEITVEENTDYNVGTINLFPEINAEETSIFGKVYFDTELTDPAYNVNIVLKDQLGNILTNNTTKTNSRGEYVINNVVAGNYIVSAQIDKNVFDKSISVQEADYQNFFEVDNIIIPNIRPEIVSYKPFFNINLKIGDSYDFSVEATDLDEEPLYYDWSVDGGILETQGNFAEFTSNTSGDFRLQVEVSDNMGGSDYHTFYIHSGNPVTFADPEFHQTVLYSQPFTSEYIFDIDLPLITTIYGQDKDINNISGVSQLVNAETLIFIKNNITDISELENMTQINYVDVSNNPISTLQPLIDNSDFSDGDILKIYDLVVDTTEITALLDKNINIFY